MRIDARGFLTLSVLVATGCDPAGSDGTTGDTTVAPDTTTTDATGDATTMPDATTPDVTTTTDATTATDADRDTTAPDDSSDAVVVTPSTCKRGLAYGHHSKADLAAVSPVTAWWYNWYFQPDDALRDGSYRGENVEYVPMVWGGTFESDELIAKIPDGARFLLGFNEPNFGAPQANLSSARAAELWPEVERIADERGLVLVSPAVNYCGGNCQNTDPFDYLEDFFAACHDCRVDKVAFHIYVGCRPPGANKAQWLIDHVEKYKARFSQPLWLTEFACNDAASFDEQIAFMRDAIAYLEGDARIERYAWFSGRFDGLDYVDVLGADGQLTPLGQAFVDAPAAADCHRQ